MFVLVDVEDMQQNYVSLEIGQKMFTTNDSEQKETLDDTKPFL